MKIQTVKGTHDFLPAENALFRMVEAKALNISKRFGYGEIQTPIFEFSDVFHRSIGETSDVVHKETYTFLDRGGESLTLRPEGTAGIARAFVSEGLAQKIPLKLFYKGPMFRYERPQKGRYRQFHQIGVECLGIESPLADIESLALAWMFLKELQISESCHLEINTLGDRKSREVYRQKLVEFLSPLRSELSPDSQMRFEKNPLRILDSKDPKDRELLKNAPVLQDCLSTDGKIFYDRVLKGLDVLKIPYVENQKLVRGLDYYCHTVFEFVTSQLGAQGTVLAGGRYDGLIESLGGPATPGIGWAAGTERLMELLPEVLKVGEKPPIVILPADEESELSCLQIAQTLRQMEWSTEILWSGNFGKKLKKANAMGVQWAIILGTAELEKGVVSLKNFKNGEQKEISLKDLETFGF